mgnify:CR=1 FL=1
MLKNTRFQLFRVFAFVFLLNSFAGLTYGKERMFTVYFMKENASFDPCFHQNKVQVDSLGSYLRELEADEKWQLDSIRVSAYASPDGPTRMNDSISNLRGWNLSRYITANFGVADSLVRYRGEGVAWSRLASWVMASDYADKDEIVHIIEMPIDRPYRRILLLEQLDYGWTYQKLRDTYFPQLRFAEITVSSSEVRRPEVVVAEPAVQPEVIDTLVSVEPVAIEEPVPVKHVPRFALKTNIVALGAGVANLGVEFRIGRNMSFELPVMFSPYTIKSDYRIRVFAVQPEYRFWFSEAFSKHFLGIHASGAFFNVALDGNNRYQNTYERPLWGAGLSYGYFLRLGSHCGLEFTLGAGYAHIDYNVYRNVPNGEKYDSGTKEYWGLTKLGINFVYRF